MPSRCDSTCRRCARAARRGRDRSGHGAVDHASSIGPAIASCPASASDPTVRSRRSRSSRAGRSRDVRSIALDTSSRTSVVLTRILCARRFGIIARRSCRTRRISPRCWRPPTRRCSSAIRRCSLDHARAWGREDRPRRGVDDDDRAAVRLGILGRPAGRGGRGDWSRCCRRRPSRAWRTRTRSPTTYCRGDPDARRRSAQRYLREN